LTVTLGEDVGELQRGGDVENPNVTGGDMLADEVQVNLHVLRALMLHGIGGEVDCTDVVAVDEGGALEGTVELMEELS
jgi:nucleoside-triphosphatase THEP1